MLQIKKMVETLVDVEVIKLYVNKPLNADSDIVGFKCTACKTKIGYRTYGIAWIRDDGNERSLGLCEQCVNAAKESCNKIIDETA